MRKQIALFTTVAALAVTPAFAQSTTTPDKPSAPQAQPSTPAPGGSSAQSPSTSSPSATSPSTMQDKSATAPAGEKFVNTQTSGQWLASDIMGMNVLGSNNDEKIGTVSDLLVDNDGNILAAVVGVGGFLGIGQKNVAITFDTMNITSDQDGDPQAKLTLTKEELENAPEFKTAAAAKSEAQRQSAPGTSSPATKPAMPRN